MLGKLLQSSNYQEFFRIIQLVCQTEGKFKGSTYRTVPPTISMHVKIFNNDQVSAYVYFKISTGGFDFS